MAPTSVFVLRARTARSLSVKVIPTDSDLLRSIYEHASQKAACGPGWLFIETAGGVHSPSPTGTTQADLYMPLRCPVILVGDTKLGGISLTISAFESLKLRGYDVEMVLMFNNREHDNYQYLSEIFWEKYGGTPVFACVSYRLLGSPRRRQSYGSCLGTTTKQA